MVSSVIAGSSRRVVAVSTAWSGGQCRGRGDEALGLHAWARLVPLGK